MSGYLCVRIHHEGNPDTVFCTASYAGVSVYSSV